MQDLFVTQDAVLEGTRRKLHFGDVTAFFTMVDERDVPPPTILDGFVFGILFYAMSTGHEMRVHGAMSREALRNIDEFQDAWTLWKPELYRKITVLPDAIIDNQSHATDAALSAFSGGVDSIFTLLRHRTGILKETAYPLTDAVLVHGFDVPLSKTEQLNALKTRVTPLLKDCGVRLRVIRTNLKELRLQNWEDSFTAQLAACMHNYSHEFGCGLVGSSEPYDHLVIPWGSSPITDYLLSGASMRIVHDGAGFSRTCKVEEIARSPLATSVVKVCWQGPVPSENCGVCEKCVRSLLNFKAVGVEHPAGFAAPLDVRQIDSIHIHNDIAYNELESVLNYARQHGQTGEWIDALDRKIRHYRGWINRNPRIRKAIELAKTGRFDILLRKALSPRLVTEP